MFAVMLMSALAATTPLVPSGQWKIDYAEQNCVLSRSFATDGGDITLTLVPNPTLTTDLILFVPESGKGSSKGSSSQPQILFPQIGHPVTTVSYVLQDKPYRVLRAQIPSEFFLSLSEKLHVKINDRDISIPMANSAKAVAALKACQDDLFRTWELDRETTVYAFEFRRETTVAGGLENTSRKGTAWFDIRDFPATSLGKDGLVKALWRVGLDRKPYDCRIIQGSGIADFDKSTCATILKKAKYAKIVDAQGKPSVGWDWQSIIWRGAE